MTNLKTILQEQASALLMDIETQRAEVERIEGELNAAKEKLKELNKTARYVQKQLSKLNGQ
jgi:septal ring factor EnvC (AmiA/AmiB activator)